MKVNKIQPRLNFREQQTQEKRKPEFIDKLNSAIHNQSDINDCVAVPRGIFKAYLFIMGGFAMLGISGALPQKMKTTKSALTIAGNLMNLASAFFFAKPFAFRGVSPTVKPDELNKQDK